MEIRVRGVKKVVAKGRAYYYHRATGERINHAPESAAFVARVEELDARVVAPASRHLPDTIGALVESYRSSPEWANLKKRTKVEYDKVLDSLDPLYGMPAATLTTAGVMKLRDVAYNKHGWWFANYTVTVVSAMFKWAGPYFPKLGNPARSARKLPRPKDMPRKNRAWSAAELACVIDAATGGIRAAVALGAYVGLREGDALRVTWAARQEGGILVTQSKTSDPVWVPEYSVLTGILDAEKKRRQATTIVANESDRPYTGDGFRAVFFKLIRKLEANGLVGSGLTFHGLRTTAATVLADLGCDDRDIAAVTGHRSPNMVRRYTEAADRKRRAKGAIIRLERANRKRTKNGKPA
jgi:integrase